MNWDDARVFLAVARAGSLRGAASALDLGLATVARRVERLEAALGVPLFLRNQSGYRLSDEGASLVSRAEALEAAAHAFDAGASARSQIAGQVRLATAETLAAELILPALPRLLGRHPRLSLALSTDIASVDLNRHEADLALRMQVPLQGHVTRQRLTRLGYGLYGKAEMVAAHDGGAQVPLIGWDASHANLPAARWVTARLAGRSPVLTTTTLSAQATAAQTGLGLAVLPDFLGRRLGLTRAGDETGLTQDMWLVIHRDLATVPRVRAVADFLHDLIAEHRALLAG
ncbi:LysR family transcriptional regulator [Actibacterium sp. D379-3]